MSIALDGSRFGSVAREKIPVSIIATRKVTAMPIHTSRVNGLKIELHFDKGWGFLATKHKSDT